MKTPKHLLVLPPEAYQCTMEWIDPFEIQADMNYQRTPYQRWVQTLAHIVESGYGTPKIAANRRPDGTLVAVDGFHRVLANQLAKTPKICVDVYHVHPDLEAKLFLILNNAKRIAPNYLVRAWEGPIAREIVIPANARGGLLTAQINFTNNTRLPFAASHLAKGIHAALTGMMIWQGGGLQGLLAHTDERILKDKRKAIRSANDFLAILAREFQTSRAFELVLIAMGKVFYDYGGPKSFDPKGRDRKWIKAAHDLGRQYSEADDYVTIVLAAWGYTRQANARKAAKKK